MYNEVITLVSDDVIIDEYGDTIRTGTRRDVFADMRSIGQAEFYQAAAVGMKPEIKFVIPDFIEYNGEKRLMYKAFGDTEEREFNVIRTYRKNNTLEIVCVRGVEK